MNSQQEIVSVMNLIQNLSADTIPILLNLLKVKFGQEKDMNFATHVLPSLIMKIKIYSTFHSKHDDQIKLSQINNLIQTIIPLFEDYFNHLHYKKEQQNAYLKFCQVFAYPTIR